MSKSTKARNKLLLDMPRWKRVLLRRGRMSNSDVLQAHERMLDRRDEMFADPPAPPTAGTILGGKNENYEAQMKEYNDRLRQWKVDSFQNFQQVFQEELNIQWHHIVDRRMGNLGYVMIGTILGLILGLLF